MLTDAHLAVFMGHPKRTWEWVTMLGDRQATGHPSYFWLLSANSPIKLYKMFMSTRGLRLYNLWLHRVTHFVFLFLNR